MKVAVLDHGMGNLRSVAKALEAAGAEVAVTSDTDEIESRDALCVPGQGIFGRCVDTLSDSGHGDLICDWVGQGKPFLGICLGMQVLFDHSEEGDHDGLGLITGEVRKLQGKVTVPHIGWNQVEAARRPSPPRVSDTFYYFDHSFAAYPSDDSVVAGWCEHGDRFAATVRTGSILGVQFHPEKSGADGIALLKEWVTNS